MEVGKRIAAIRKEQGMSQEQFGQLFHVTRQTVSNWENEKSYPDLQTLVKISDRFEVSMDKLLKENAPMVRKIDWERKVGELFKKLFIAAGVVLLLAIFIVPVLSFLLSPATAEEDRNVSDIGRSKIFMYLNFPEAMPSRAIVRTFKKEDYDNFSEKKMEKIYKETAGKIEGDAPPFYLQEDGEKLWVVMQNYAHRNIMLDAPPTIRLKIYSIDSAIPITFMDEAYEGQLVQQTGVMTKVNCGSSRWMKNPFTPGEVYADFDYNGHYWKQCRMEVWYKIEGKEYVSVTSFAVFYYPEET